MSIQEITLSNLRKATYWWKNKPAWDKTSSPYYETIRMFVAGDGNNQQMSAFEFSIPTTATTSSYTYLVLAIPLGSSAYVANIKHIVTEGAEKSTSDIYNVVHPTSTQYVYSQSAFYTTFNTTNGMLSNQLTSGKVSSGTTIYAKINIGNISKNTTHTAAFFRDPQAGSAYSDGTIIGKEGTSNYKLYLVTRDYTVTVSNGNTTAIKSVSGGGTVSEDSNATVAATANTGYKFTNWSGYSTSTSNPLTITNIKSDISITAHGTTETYTDTYNSNGGSGGGTRTGAYLSTYDMPSASRDGYTFNGWYTSTSGGTRVGGAGDSTTHNASNDTYYAQWTANKYKITYNGNGGYYQENETWSENVTYGSLYALQSNNDFFVRPGYKFLGWNTSPTGQPGDNGDWTERIRPDGVDPKNWNSTTPGVWTWAYDHDNTVVYAMWEAQATMFVKYENKFVAGTPFIMTASGWKRALNTFVKGSDGKWKRSTR